MALTEIENGLDEELLEGVAPSGLRFILNPKPAFSKTMGMISIRFGSTDHLLPGDPANPDVPAGTAHFLEHKLFEDVEGDVSDRFAALGASCNAGTGFTTTSYLFTCTKNHIDCLELLLGFVQNPYFTPELIAKEQGIIGQEIKMYNDDPEWIVYFNLLKGLYRDHPVKENIAGSIASIGKIDVDLLQRCYRTYYRPGNMVLVLVGGMSPDEAARIICGDGDGRESDKQGISLRNMIQEPPGPVQELTTQEMVVARPKLLMGFKDLDIKANWRMHQKKEVVTKMAIDVIFGKSSLYYEELYVEGIIDDSFSASYSGYIDFGLATFGGDTDNPLKFRDRILSILDRAIENGIDPEDIECQKNKYMGRYIRAFNSIESTAYTMMNLYFRSLSPSQAMEIIEEIEHEDINRRVRDLFD